MSNKLADFPPERFVIRAHCACGHDAPVPLARLPAGLTVAGLRSRLRCGSCGGREVGISIIWIAAGGYAHGYAGQGRDSAAAPR
jgi:hypothetical protein